MNHGTFAGRVGQDGELRSTPNGKRVLNFSVAVDVFNGKEKEALWVRCALWGERAEKLSQYITKGKQVTVGGDVTLRTWSKDGKSGASLELNVRDVALQGGGEQQAKEAPKPDPREEDPFGDDVPF